MTIGLRMFCLVVPAAPPVLDGIISYSKATLTNSDLKRQMRCRCELRSSLGFLWMAVRRLCSYMCGCIYNPVFKKSLKKKNLIIVNEPIIVNATRPWLGRVAWVHRPPTGTPKLYNSLKKLFYCAVIASFQAFVLVFMLFCQLLIIFSS